MHVRRGEEAAADLLSRGPQAVKVASPQGLPGGQRP